MLDSYRKIVNFIKKYAKAINASSGSEVDANANVANKNIATCMGEIPKKTIIGTNRLLMHDKISEMYGAELADEYIRQLESHEIYKHDETSILPYTYDSKETLLVNYNGKSLLISFEDLYDMCEEDEELVDSEKIVYIKRPKNLKIIDKNGETAITVLTKKKRHRDLVCVKTKGGENIIVTDNHPLIVNDNINDTVEAINSIGKQQYKVPFNKKFARQIYEELPLKYTEDYGSYVAYREKNMIQYSNKTAKLNKEFGYFVGFFIAEGWYKKNGTDFIDGIILKQKNKNILYKCCEYLYNSTGIRATVSELKDQRGFYNLTCSSRPLVDLLLNEFQISEYATNKKLPINLFSYSDDFNIGLLSGIIDGDGSISSNGKANIRLSSRKCISQLSYLLNYFGLCPSMTYYDGTLNAKEDSLIKSSFPIFGVDFNVNEEMKSISYKCKNVTSPERTFYKTNDWSEIIKVTKIVNDKYLAENEFIYDITTESHSFVMNNIWVHNCVSITMYPFLFGGLKNIGGISNAPTNLQSFQGSFINLVFAIASQFAGAVATPEFLTYLDYFIRKEFGDDYYLKADELVTGGLRPKTIDKVITDGFEQVVYSLNQPASARNYQSVFWNIAYFDKPYFEGIFGEFVFPDGTEPKWDSVDWLQKRFMKWFNKERLKTPLTYPVETMNLLNDGVESVDKEYADFNAEMYSEGHSFFTYTSNSVDSLASCCRLRNEIQENEFSYTLGAGGVATGSKGVLTININRLVQNSVTDKNDFEKAKQEINIRISEQIEKCHKYLLAYNEIIKDYFNANLLPIYNAGYITLEKQFLTIGINGFVEGAEFLGLSISPNKEYYEYGTTILKPIYESNKKARTKEVMFNTEFVPAENLGVKNAKWDKEDGYFVPRDCYNSYFYKVEDETCNPIDKFILHGKELTQYLDGGSALHMNLEEHLTKEQYLALQKVAIKTGCSYYTYNIPNTICNDCGFISKHKLCKCEKCGSENLDYLTRVIGYLTRVSSFSEARIKEESKRYYGKFTS